MPRMAPPPLGNAIVGTRSSTSRRRLLTLRRSGVRWRDLHTSCTPYPASMTAEQRPVMKFLHPADLMRVLRFMQARRRLGLWSRRRRLTGGCRQDPDGVLSAPSTRTWRSRVPAVHRRRPARHLRKLPPPEGGGFTLARLLGYNATRRRRVVWLVYWSPAANIDRSDYVGQASEPARRTNEQRLCLPIGFVDTSACGTRSRRIARINAVTAIPDNRAL